jgi:uncharacterized protein YjbJ (UPF0337 family)
MRGVRSIIRHPSASLTSQAVAAFCSDRTATPWKIDCIPLQEGQFDLAFRRASVDLNSVKKEIPGMNLDILEGKLKQISGEMRRWWGKLTDDDLQQVGGNVDSLVGKLQERYGYSREQAEAEVDRRLTEHETVSKR